MCHFSFCAGLLVCAETKPVFCTSSETQAYFVKYFSILLYKHAMKCLFFSLFLIVPQLFYAAYSHVNIDNCWCIYLFNWCTFLKSVGTTKIKHFYWKELLLESPTLYSIIKICLLVNSNCVVFVCKGKTKLFR